MEQDTTIIVLNRRKSISYLFRAFSVVIDDQKVGRIKSGETKRFRVPSGGHAIGVAVDFYKSRQLRLDLRPGETISLDCGDMAPATLRESFSLKGMEESLNALVKPGQHLYVRLAGHQGKDSQPGQLQPRLALHPGPAGHTRAVRAGCSMFVSYRRDDSLHVTGRICDHLSNQFGQEAVFRDLDSMPLGVDFRTHIEETIGNCSALLAIVGMDWLEARDKAGNRRLDDPADNVRVEIASALKGKIAVIPVLVKGAPMPEEHQLPENIRQLKYQSGIAIHEDYFQAGMQRLITQLEDKGRSGNSATPAGRQKFCIQCGGELTPGNKFCIHCGKPV